MEIETYPPGLVAVATIVLAGQTLLGKKNNNNNKNPDNYNRVPPASLLGPLNIAASGDQRGPSSPAVKSHNGKLI